MMSPIPMRTDAATKSLVIGLAVASVVVVSSVMFPLGSSARRNSTSFASDAFAEKPDNLTLSAYSVRRRTPDEGCAD